MEEATAAVERVGVARVAAREEVAMEEEATGLEPRGWEAVEATVPERRVKVVVEGRDRASWVEVARAVEAQVEVVKVEVVRAVLAKVELEMEEAARAVVKAAVAKAVAVLEAECMAGAATLRRRTWTRRGCWYRAST